MIYLPQIVTISNVICGNELFQVVNLDFKAIVASRYAAKEFDGRVVPEGTFGELVELIRMAPSSFNIQPWKIKAITGAKTKAALSGASYSQKQITTCSHLLVFCADTDLDAIISKLERQMLDGGAKPEAIKGYLDAMHNLANRMTAEQKLSWVQRQAYLALGNALNGAKSLGLDSCPMEGFNPKEYSRILKLPANLVPTVLCPVGYAADKPKPKMRSAAKDILL